MASNLPVYDEARSMFGHEGGALYVTSTYDASVIWQKEQWVGRSAYFKIINGIPVSLAVQHDC